MSELTDLLAYIDRVRQEMDQAVERIDPELELCPGWKIKETLVHITAWEIVIHKAIATYQAGDPPYFLREQDFDRFNQEAVESRSGWSLDEVIQEWKNVRTDLRKTIEDIDESNLGQELVLPWGSERTLAELIEIIGEHEDEHLENILKVTG